MLSNVTILLYQHILKITIIYCTRMKEKDSRTQHRQVANNSQDVGQTLTSGAAAEELEAKKHLFVNPELGSIRPELQEILQQSKKIRRFTGDDLPKDVVIDNVFDHTERCCKLADSLPLDKNLKSKVKKTLLLHDLPEVVNAIKLGVDYDPTAPQKEQNPGLEEQIARGERETARQIFLEEEFLLTEVFENSGNFLNSKNEEEISEVGLIAYVIDKIEANITLHHSLARWVLSEHYDPAKINPHRSLTFLFRQYKIFWENLNKIQPTIPAATTCKLLLATQMEYIRMLWSQIDSEGHMIPDSLKQYLEKQWPS